MEMSVDVPNCPYPDAFFSLFFAPSFVTGFWSEYPDS